LEQLGALPTEIQERFVAVVKEKKFCRTGSTKNIQLDVRLIADTVGLNPGKTDHEGIIDDLCAIIMKNVIAIPNLDERKEDLSLLIDHFVIHYNQQNQTKKCLAPKTRKAIENYSWPGNIHELKSAIFRAARLCKKDQIQLSNLPVPVRMCFLREKTSIFGYTDEFDLRWWSLRKFLKSKEKEYVNQVLKIAKGDKAKAAKLLGISLATFYNKYGEDS